MSDFGNYTCEASNDKGATWTKFPLALTPAQPPDVPLNCSETTVDVDELHVSFACVAGFDGGAPQKEFKLAFWIQVGSVNATRKDKLDRVPRKDDTFHVALARSLQLRRGQEYRVCLHLCNKFGCSVCFDRGLAFSVPTTPAPTKPPLTIDPRSGVNGGFRPRSDLSSGALLGFWLLGYFRYLIAQ